MTFIALPNCKVIYIVNRTIRCLIHPIIPFINRKLNQNSNKQSPIKARKNWRLFCRKSANQPIVKQTIACYGYASFSVRSKLIVLIFCISSYPPTIDVNGPVVWHVRECGDVCVCVCYGLVWTRVAATKCIKFSSGFSFNLMKYFLPYFFTFLL